MLNEQHLHTHLLTNKLHEGFAANYAQFFSTFSFKSGQTTQQKITQRTKRKKRRKNYPISFNVYICPMKFNLIKGQAGQKRRKERKGEWTGKSNRGSTNQSLLPKADLAQRDEAAAAGWACSNEIALSSGQGNNVPCTSSLVAFPCRPMSHVRCPVSVVLIQCPFGPLLIV